jgi:16S rRNA processing protein RimM
MDGMVTAGRVGGLFGNKGELTLVLYDNFPHDPNKEEPLLIMLDGHVVPLFLEKFVRRGVRGATVVFVDIDTPDRATELVGREFSIRVGTTATGSEDELCFEDLIGWEAEVDDGRLGRITAFVESEFNPLIEIELDGETELIPAVEEFISEVDEGRRRVVFSLPDGILGLNK